MAYIPLWPMLLLVLILDVRNCSAIVENTAPGRPKSVEIEDRSPTMVLFTVAPPDENGGVEVDGYRVEFDNRMHDFQLNQEIRIENLNPSTVYIFRIRAKNEVGAGNYIEHSFTTDAIREPYPLVITSDRQGDYPHTYVLRWEKPRTGGLSIKQYEFIFRKILVEDGTWEWEESLTDWGTKLLEDDPMRPMLFYTLEGLNASSYYELRARARNDIGWSAISDFIFRTSEANGAQRPNESGSHQPIEGDKGNEAGPVDKVIGAGITVTGSLLCIVTGYLATLL